MNKCVRLAALALILVATALSASAAVWQRGTLYNLKPSSAKQLVVADQGARLSDVASADLRIMFHHNRALRLMARH